MNDIAIISLGGKRGGFAIVSPEDFAAINRSKWRKNKNGYVIRSVRKNGLQRNIFMHRQILDSDAPRTDHRNHCEFDNTRRNLRPATYAENAQHRIKRQDTKTRFKGVRWENQRRKWRARIQINHREIALGRFDDEEEAARAYNHAARQYHGQFAFLNPVAEHKES